MPYFPPRPPLGTQLDRYGPLSVGLDVALNFAEPMGGMVLTDSTGRHRFTPTGSPGYIGTPVGQAFNGATGKYLTCTDYEFSTTAVSVALLVACTDTNGTGSGFGNVAGATDASRCQAHMPFSGTIYFDFGGQGAGQRISYAPGAGFFGTNLHFMVFTAGPAGLFIYEDGAVKVSYTAGAASRTNTVGGILVNNYTGNGGNGAEPNNYAAYYVWSRQLTQQQVSALTANPWAIYSTTRRRFAPPASAAADTLLWASPFPAVRRTFDIVSV